MLPGPPTQFNVTENLPGMGMQLRATDSRIVIPWTAERRLVDARVSGLMDSPGKLFTQFFEVLTSSSLAPSLLSSSEYRPGHALDLQHTGTSSTGDFTGASNNIGLSPLPKQIPPARDFPFLPNVAHAPPTLFTTYTNRDLAIASFAASYPTIKREKVMEIVDEAIGKLENILLHDFDMDLFPEI